MLHADGSELAWLGVNGAVLAMGAVAGFSGMVFICAQVWHSLHEDAAASIR